MSDPRPPEAAAAPGASAATAAPVVPVSTLSERLTRAATLELALSALAVIALVLILVGAPRVITGLVALAALLGPLTLGGRWGELIRGRGPTGGFQLSRTALALAAASLASPTDVTAWIVGGCLALLVTFERSLARIVRSAIPYAANMPELGVRNSPPFPVGRIFVIDTAAIIVVGAFYFAGLPSWAGIPLVPIAAAPSVALAVDGILRIRARRLADATLFQSLEARDLRFLVHWDAPAGTEFQLEMWVPYLEAAGLPFLVVLRNPATFAAVATATRAPVVVRRFARELDTVVTSTVRTAFYMNNASRNTHMVRFAGIEHVQLNHGDSDKPPSYSPVFRMYDRNFVAGQAAVDRFADNGVAVRPGFFELVGRPQLEEIEPPRDGPVTTVLYAPTWGGHTSDADLSSLPIGPTIVQALLDHGLSVIYRPHPYTDQHAEHAAASARVIELLTHSRAIGGGAHVLPPVSTTEMSLIDCFNASDAMVSDVSGVTSDYLASDKPLAVTTMNETTEAFAQYPIGRAAYLIGRDGRELDRVVAEITGDDPLRLARHRIREYVIGDASRETARSRFLEAIWSVTGRPEDRSATAESPDTL